MINGISTNLTRKELTEVLAALDGGKTRVVRGTTSAFASSAGQQFTWARARYEIAESNEVTTHLFKVPRGAREGMTCLTAAAKEVSPRLAKALARRMRAA